MNWFCIVILAIPLVFLLHGMQRGMVRTAFSVISVVAALFLGNILNPYISEFLREKTSVYEVVQKKCEEGIDGILEEQLTQITGKTEENTLIQSLPLPESIQSMLLQNNNAQGYQQLLVQNFGEYLSNSIAGIIVSTISMIVTFLVISILLNFLGGLLDGVFSLPLLSLVNRVGGAVLGAIQGVLIVWLIFLVITLFWEAAWAREAVSMIQENNLTQYLYDKNLLVQFLSGVLI